jgi:hypothetical protein
MIFIVGKQLDPAASLESTIIRVPSRSLGEGWCFIIHSSFACQAVVERRPVLQHSKHVLRGKPAISKQ